MNEQPYATIRCEWTFRCPKVWHLLDPTDVDEVRHCGACERDVFLVQSEADLQAHADKNHCIAVLVVETVPPTETPRGSMMLGLVRSDYAYSPDGTIDLSALEDGGLPVIDETEDQDR